MQPQGAPQQQYIAGTPQQVVIAPGQQVMMVQGQRDSLPIVIGVIYALWNLLALGLMGLVVMAGLFIADAGSGNGSDEIAALGGFVLIIGIIGMLFSMVGIYAGVEIARYKKRGVYIGLAMCGLSIGINLLFAVMAESPPDMFNLGCNVLCGGFIAMPLMISSIGAQME